jgi:drug/metabolite transporter (DMT)-like permease|tara:strand:- start:132 stop:992 length:861 start_codon:yes stop_codon:yes gene_type:complete
MLGTSGFAILIGISGRELSSEMSLFQVMFCRNFVCLTATICAMYFIGWNTIRTRFVGRHVVRNIIHFLATYLWFFGIVSIPMAEVFALEFTTPLWTAILAAFFLRERFGARRVVGTLLGFIGVLVILRPGLAMIHPAAFAVIGSAMMLATMYVLTKSVITYDSPWTILFWMNLVQLPISLTFAIPDWTWPSTPLIPWVVLVGVAGFGIHYSISKALVYADASLVVPFDFFRLPLIAIVAWLLYNEALDPFVFIGAMIMVGGNVLNVRENRVGTKNSLVNDPEPEND